MEKKIESLYRELTDIAAGYLIYQKRDNVEQVKKKVSQIEEFIVWFLTDNIFGIEQELYQALKDNLIDILNDLLCALENNDRVLLHDAIAYGVIEYLKMFIVSEQEEL